MDPLAPKYPFYSPYAFSGNRVLDAVELEGLEPVNTNKNNDGAKTYPSVATGGSIISLYNGSLRIKYIVRTKSLQPLYDEGSIQSIEAGYRKRYEIKSNVREQMVFSQGLKKALNEHPSTENKMIDYKAGDRVRSFYKSDKLWNGIGIGSTMLGTVGTINSVNNVFNAEDKPRQFVAETGSFAGAWAGSESGAIFMLQVSKNPLAVGAGAVLAGIVGGVLGEDAATELFDNIPMILEESFITPIKKNIEETASKFEEGSNQLRLTQPGNW
ncbi:MAG: hypothetical protein R3C61_10735 [Bacteroidia bacterium]